jgi:hypothetical protein
MPLPPLPTAPSGGVTMMLPPPDVTAVPELAPPAPVPEAPDPLDSEKSLLSEASSLQAATQRTASDPKSQRTSDADFFSWRAIMGTVRS